MNQNNGPRCKDTLAALNKTRDDRAVQWVPRHSKPDKGQRTKDQRPGTKDQVIRPRKGRPVSTWCQSA